MMVPVTMIGVELTVGAGGVPVSVKVTMIVTDGVEVVFEPVGASESAMNPRQ
jgi:hypothetical protein